MTVIDMHAVFKDRKDLFFEGGHANQKGAAVFARTVYDARMEKTKQRQTKNTTDGFLCFYMQFSLPY